MVILVISKLIYFIQFLKLCNKSIARYKLKNYIYIFAEAVIDSKIGKDLREVGRIYGSLLYWDTS